MRKILLLIALLVPPLASAGMAISPGTGVHTHADASTGGQLGPLPMVDSITSTKACAAGYTRRGASYCEKNASLSLTALTAGTCTTLTLPDASAKMLELVIQVVPRANNAVALRSATVGGYGDNGSCVALINQVTLETQEFAATAASTAIGDVISPMQLTWSTGPALKFTRDAGNQGTAGFDIRGYWEY